MKSPKKKKPRSSTIGLPPGTLLAMEEGGRQKVLLNIFSYNEAYVDSREVDSDFDCKELLDNKRVTWLNIDGIHDITILENIGRTLNIHPLVLEDIQNTDQRPKVEDYGEYFFLTMKMLRWDDLNGSVIAEQVSLITGETFVISFQEYSGDVFSSIRQRIISGTGRIRKENASYLTYALLDAVVDHSFLVLEELEACFEELEEKILFTSSGSDIMPSLHKLKSQLTLVGRNIRPLREILTTIHREEISLIPNHIRFFFKDIYDHSLRLMDTLDVLREMGVSLVELHSTNVSNTMNSIMKVLTIIATIFIPLTFIAGIYGMNFRFMPELTLVWAYPVVLGLMAGVALIMILFFRKKKWL